MVFIFFFISENKTIFIFLFKSTFQYEKHWILFFTLYGATELDWIHIHYLLQKHINFVISVYWKDRFPVRKNLKECVNGYIETQNSVAVQKLGERVIIKGKICFRKIIWKAISCHHHFYLEVTWCIILVIRHLKCNVMTQLPDLWLNNWYSFIPHWNNSVIEYCFDLKKYKLCSRKLMLIRVEYNQIMHSSYYLQNWNMNLYRFWRWYSYWLSICSDIVVCRDKSP